MAHYKVIIAIVGLCMGYAYYDTRDASPDYTSKATVEVDQKIVLGLQGVSEADMRDTDILYTQVVKATSSVVMEKAITTNKWLQDYYNVNTNDIVSVRKAAGIIAKYTRAELQPDTLLIDILVKTKEEELTYHICDAVSNGFSQYNKDENTQDTRATIEGLQKTFKKTKSELEKATKEFQEYSLNISLAGMETQLEDLETDIRKAQKEQDALKRDISNLERDLERIVNLGYKEDGDLQANLTIISNKFEEFIQIPSIYDDKNFIERLEDLEEKESIVKDLSAELRSAHPKMVAALTDVKNYKENVITTIAEIPRFIKRRIALTSDKIEDLKLTIEDYSNERTELRSQSFAYNELKSTMDGKQALLDIIRERKDELEVNVENKPSNITVLEHAKKASPNYPNTNQTYLMWLIAGLALSYGYLYLLHKMDQSIKSVEQAEQVLQLPVLAAVPAAEPDGQEIKNRLIMKGSSNSTCSEAFRSLRVNIESMNRSKSNKVVVFTSSMPSEGKTFTSINYAASLAQQGHKTLLIDMDLRKPAVGKDFGIEKSNYVGLTEIITSDEKLERFPDLPMYQPTDGLSILHGGPLIDNPAERLSSYSVERIIEKAREHFDRVVIDSAPLGPVGDTLTVARLADMVCLVVRSAKTPSKTILRIIDTLHRHGHTPAGIVLNFMKIKSGYGSYYYYYSSDKQPEITSTKPPYKRKSDEPVGPVTTPTKFADGGSLEETDPKKKQTPSELESVLKPQQPYTRRNKSIESHPSA